MKKLLLLAIFSLLFLAGCSGTEKTIVSDQNISEIPAELKTVGTIIPENLTAPVNESESPDNTTIEQPFEISDNRSKIYFFYSPLCFASRAILPKVDELDAKYNTSVNIVRYNILNQRDLDKYNEFANLTNLSSNDRVIPLIYYGDSKLIGMFEINDSLESVLMNVS